MRKSPLGWVLATVGGTSALWSRYLDYKDTVALNLSPDFWLVVGLLFFFIAVLIIVYQFQEQTTAKIESAGIKPPEQIVQPPSHQYLADSYIRGKAIYLMDLLAPGSKPIISDRTIEDCEIRGPAMVGFLGNVTIADSGFEGDIVSLCVEVTYKRIIFGEIGLLRCTFRRCQFKAIGILGTKEQIEKAKRGFRQSTSDKGDSQS